MSEPADKKRRIPVDGEKPNSEEREHSGYWDAEPSDNPAGYGGGRERAEEFSRGSFGEAGWSASRTPGHQTESDPPAQEGTGGYQRPQGAKPTDTIAPGWDEKYARENADKYGQAGDKPTEQRGPSQSEGGFQSRMTDRPATEDATPRSTYSAKDAEAANESINTEHKEKP